jgi:hypothetical protein
VTTGLVVRRSYWQCIGTIKAVIDKMNTLQSEADEVETYQQPEEDVENEAEDESEQAPNQTINVQRSVQKVAGILCTNPVRTSSPRSRHP